jgi:hypothetical protein
VSGACRRAGYDMQMCARNLLETVLEHAEAQAAPADACAV